MNPSTSSKKKDKGKKLPSKKQPKKSSAKPQSDSEEENNDSRIKMSDTNRAKVFAEIRDKKKILFGNLEGMSDGLVQRRVAWKEVLAFCKALGYDYKSYKPLQASWNRAKRRVQKAWQKSLKTGGGGEAAFMPQLKTYDKVVFNAIKEDALHLSKLKVIPSHTCVEICLALSFTALLLIFIFNNLDLFYFLPYISVSVLFTNTVLLPLTSIFFLSV